jgi:hypothetical protein
MGIAHKMLLGGNARFGDGPHPGFYINDNIMCKARNWVTFKPSGDHFTISFEKSRHFPQGKIFHENALDTELPRDIELSMTVFYADRSAPTQPNTATHTATAAQWFAPSDIPKKDGKDERKK